MQQKINIEDKLYEEVIKCLPATANESAFVERYADAEKNNMLDLESDLTDVLGECEKRVFRIGFRLAMSFMNGKTEFDINELMA